VAAPIGTISNEEDLLVPSETWVAILEPALCQDSAAVELLARLLFTLKKAIEDEPDGIRRASSTLTAGIELMYLYTDAHRAALKLYLRSMTGNLKPQDEPLRLINEALKRDVDSEPARKRRVLKKERR
jgi:hypothetical protein